MKCQDCPVMESCKELNKQNKSEMNFDKCCFASRYKDGSATCNECGWREPCRIISEKTKIIVVSEESACSMQ